MPIWPLLRSRLRSLLLVVDIPLMMEQAADADALRRLAHALTPRPLVSHIHVRHKFFLLLARQVLHEALSVVQVTHVDGSNDQQGSNDQDNGRAPVRAAAAAAARR